MVFFGWFFLGSVLVLMFVIGFTSQMKVSPFLIKPKPRLLRKNPRKRSDYR